MLSKNQIKEIQSLQLKKFRDQKKQFIAEGIKTVLEIIRSRPAAVTLVFATESFITQHKAELKANEINYFEVDDIDLKKISLQNNPNSVLAVCRYFEEEKDLIDFDKNFSFYLDDIRDPGNFGTIIRLADWFGMPAIYCSHSTCDLYNPKVIQASMGSFLRVQVIYKNLEDLIAKGSINTVYGALLNGKDLYHQTLKNGLIVIGNEANGINADNLKHINHPITIPSNSKGGTESLNAAVAASIIASEFYRQLLKN